MAQISLPEWKTILVDIQHNVENAWARQNPWTGSSWQTALPQVKLLAVIPKGTFPTEFRCPILRDAVTAHEELEAATLEDHQLSPQQIGHLRDHMIRLYQVLLVNEMSQGVLDLRPPRPMSTLIPIFHEMMDSGLKDCAFYLKSRETEDDRMNHSQVEQFASLLTQWCNVDAKKKNSALAILKSFLKKDFKGFPTRRSRCDLPDESIEEVSSELDEMSMPTVSDAATDTSSPSSGKKSRVGRFSEKLSRSFPRRTQSSSNAPGGSMPTD
jgi:hypothetical protein